MRSLDRTKRGSSAVERLERRDLLAFGILLGTPISAVARQSFSGEIAELTNFSPTFVPGSVAINWGDGSPLDTTSGQIAPGSTIDNVGQYNIDGTHTYPLPGNYAVTLSVTDASSSDKETDSIPIEAVVTAPSLTFVATSLNAAPRWP